MNRKMKQKLNYAQSGVNIDAGNNLVKKIIPFVKSTNRQRGTHLAMIGFVVQLVFVLKKNRLSVLH